MTRAALARVFSPTLVERVLGAPVREVRQRGEHDVVLTLRVPGENVWLLLSAHPQSSRAYPLPDKPRAPSRPSAFRDALRHDLVGARIESIELAPDDRRLTIVARGAQTWSLHAELYGRAANLVLVDATGVIRAALRPGGERRPLAVGSIYEPLAPRADRSEPDDDGNEAVDALARRFEEGVFRADLAEARDALGRRLGRARGKLEKKRASVAARLDESDRADAIQRDGELLKANLHRITRGTDAIVVDDWYESPPTPRRIALDPLKTPQQNLEAIFKRYRKLHVGRDKTAQVLASIDDSLAALDDLAARATAALDPDGVAAVATAAERARLLRPPQRTPAKRSRDNTPGPGHLSFTSADGLPILVGRTSKENDALTMRIAKGDDVWLHVADYPGSHVVIRVPRGKPCPPETLLDAAHLAVHFSKIRGATTADVLHTQRKWITKPKKAPPGRVSVSKSSTLGLRVEPDRLARLLGKLA